jgi:tetratricopeptide (TPR) repeat protein
VLLKRLLYLPILLYFITSCSTSKNTGASRAYHNLTARYNGYYYSNVNIDEGVYKIEKSHKDNYDKILPIYIYPSPERAKATFPEFDKAIKKSSLCIQRHAIKDKKGKEIPSAGKWIDNNWINIGIAHFYKREFYSGIEAFEYVTRTYTKSDDKYSAMLWLIKTNNEIGAVSASEPIISFLKNERNLPQKIKRELPVVWADYYIRRGQNTEAIARLMEATRNTGFFRGISKPRRARYSFIIGQLSEQSRDPKRAVQYYKRTIKLKPNYEMIFYSKIKIARLIDVKRQNTEKTKKDLLKMTKEFKNTDYYDVIYYTLGEIEEKEKHINQAVFYYKRSVATSVSNSNQKAASYLRLGEIYFNNAKFERAGAYYDSAVVALPKDHPEYNSIVSRKKTLETLVGYINTINREDSLQRIARMPEKERLTFIDKLIEKYKEDQEKLAQLKEQQQVVAPGGGGGIDAMPGPPMPGMGSQTKFYFYNPATVSMGVAEFTRRWGNRKLEDNWRRSNKALTIEENEEGMTEEGPLKQNAVTEEDPMTTREYYLDRLPMNDSLIAKSDMKIINAYYKMGALYKEELQNNQKTITSLEDLNRRYPGNKYALNSYYFLYRTYLQENNQERAEYYKNKILSEFPDSEFALLIKNPDIAEELNSKKSEVEAFYTTTYGFYKDENYPQALSHAREGISKFGRNDYLPQFEFIKSMSLGKLRGIDTLEQHLKLLVARHPKSEVTPLAEEILLAIRKQKNPELFKPQSVTPVKTDTFNLNREAEHFIIALAPDNSKLVEGFKINLGKFNNIFFSEKTFTITSSLFGKDKQFITIKSFANATEAMSYYNYLLTDEDVFKEEIRKDLFEIYVILPENIALLYKDKSAEGYRIFFEDNYKKAKKNP